jgi:hypothetical protein
MFSPVGRTAEQGNQLTIQLVPKAHWVTGAVATNPAHQVASH